MRAIVLVGGEATRMRPLSRRTPKQLMPVLHKPLLEQLLALLARHGVHDVTLAMMQRNEAVRTALDDGAQLGMHLDYTYESEPLGSGGAIANAAAGWDESSWDIGALAGLDIPVLQAISTLTSRDYWLNSQEGLIPLDAANQVAIPEFDGRLITVPFSFKEVDEQGLTRYVADPERAARAAGIAVAHARLRHIAPADKRIALVLTAYPTKHARIGNAVGLDTPVSALRLLTALREARARVSDLLLLGPREDPVYWELNVSVLATVQRVLRELDVEEYVRERERHLAEQDEGASHLAAERLIGVE